MPDGLGAFALVVAAAVLALLLLLVWLLSRDRDVTRTSFGLFVERKRLTDETTHPTEVTAVTPPPYDQEDTETNPPWPAVRPPE